MRWVKRSELSCGCCLIAILTAWKQFLKISHRKSSTRVRNDRDVMCLPAHDVMVIILKCVTSIFIAQNYYILAIEVKYFDKKGTYFG